MDSGLQCDIPLVHAAPRRFAACVVLTLQPAIELLLTYAALLFEQASGVRTVEERINELYQWVLRTIDEMP